MQLLSSIRQSIFRDRLQSRSRSELAAIRERLVNNREATRYPKLPSTRVSPDSVRLGAARRKHFRNPGEFLARLAEGQAARPLRLIDHLPIMERD
jgi:hypothetical protein